MMEKTNLKSEVRRVEKELAIQARKTKILFHEGCLQIKNEQALRIWYDQRVSQCHQKLKQALLIHQSTEEQYLICYNWAKRICRSFQRASSQIEYRNGHFSFIHKANRGLTPQRLKVLTVVHDFDIRGLDNQTPAERLFQSEFPDLFEFILQDVTAFPEPRRRKRKPPESLSIRA